VKPGSQSDIFRNVISAHLQSNRDYQKDTDSSYDGSNPDVDDNYDSTWENGDVQDPQADEVAGQSSNVDGSSRPSNKQQSQSSSSSSSEGSQTDGVDHDPPPKVAPVSAKENGAGGSGKASSSTRPRQSGRGRRPLTKCRSVPVVYSGETVVRLGQICYQVPRDGS